MKTKTKRIILATGLGLASLAALAPQARAQGGVPLWTNRYNGPANDLDQVYAEAMDSNGNVFVTGRSWNGNNFDYATVAYSNSGAPLWTNFYDGPQNSDDSATAVAVDSSGNVFVTGRSAASGYIGYDYATIKYSNAGVPLWTNRYDGPASAMDVPTSMAVDSNGNVFVTGYSTAIYGNVDYATLAYSSAGVPLWTNRYNGPPPAFGTQDAKPTAVAVDSSGKVFVTGTSYVDGTGDDYATIAYSAAGVPLWTNRYDAQHNADFATALAVDSSGNVYVTGYSYHIGAGSGSDYATIKYSGAGVPLWTNRYSAHAGPDSSTVTIAVDSRGNVFVTGTSHDIDTGDDIATVGYSASGIPLWTNRYNGPGPPQGPDDVADAVAVDSDGNVFVTGRSMGTNGIDSDYVTLAYSNAGVPLWTNRYSAQVDLNYHMAIAVDRLGNVFVTGTSRDIDTRDDFATIKYSSSLAPAPRLDFERLNNQLVLSWTNSGLMLQSAHAITGPFTNILGATSPYTNLISGLQRYFRLKAD